MQNDDEELKISQILCLFSLVTAALAGVDVVKTKVRRISEVFFDGFLRSTSDIFPLLLVSVSLSWPPNRSFFSPSPPDLPKTQESCLQSRNHSFGLEGEISAYSDFSFSIETLGRFPEKEQIAINSHLLSILTSKVPISQLSRSGLSIPVSQNSEFWF